MGTADLAHTEVLSGGRTVAWCDLEPTPDAERAARVRLAITAGHLPAGVRGEIVDRVLDCARRSGIERLRLAVPLGDELIAVFRDRCALVRVRAAGATCLIDAELADSARR